MAVLTYKGGKYRNLAGNKIYDGTKWRDMTGNSKIFLSGKWYDLGWEIQEPVGEIDFPNYPGFRLDYGEEPTSNIVYLTPTGSGRRDGSSWDNAFGNINEALAAGKNVFCMEGIYRSAYAFFPVDVKLYGGFQIDNPVWEARNHLKHQSILYVDEYTAASVGHIDGCSISSGNFRTTFQIYNCIVEAAVSGYIYSNNSIACRCGGNISGGTLVSCSGGSGDVLLNCRDCTLQSSPALMVNCDCQGLYIYKESSFINSSFEHIQVSNVRNILLWNCSWNTAKSGSNAGIATSQYANFASLVLGYDNSLTKFRNTGYSPQIGVVDIGECPSPITNLSSFCDYVKSFGDWRPLTGTVLANHGGYAQPSGLDLDGVARPNPPTIGAYEPVSAEVSK